MKENFLDAAGAKDVLEALKEEKVSPKCIAQDIKFIFDEFFVGNSELKNNGEIDFALLNGQKFKIKIKARR